MTTSTATVPPPRAPAVLHLTGGRRSPFAGRRTVPGAIHLSRRVAILPPDDLPEPTGPDPVALALDGSGVLHGRFMRHRDDLQDVISARPTESANDLGGSLRGVTTAYIWRPDERAVEILPDPWGALVYRYREPGLEILSSDLGAVVAAAHAAGVTLRRSLEFVTEVAAAGSGGLTPASYEGIETLDVFEFVRVNDAGVHVATYSAGAQVFEPFATYEEGLDATQAEIEENLRAAVSCGIPAPERLAHLTGGLDTRLVLAASLSLGLTDQLRYLSMGPVSQPDRSLAERLAVEHGLRMTDWRGAHALRAPSTIVEQAAWPMDYSHGMVTAGPHVHYSASDTLVLSGGFGGFMKANYSSALRDLDQGPTLAATGAMAVQLWGTMAYSPDPKVGLYGPEVRDRRIRRLHQLRMAAEERGLSRDAALDFLFIQVRNRYFVSEITRVWNAHVHRFDPLYTLSGARLALSLPAEVRRHNVVGLDLMRRWAPDLMGFPFDRPKVSQGYRDLRGAVPPRQFARPAARPLHDGRRLPLPEGGRTDLPEMTPEMTERATAMLAPLWQVRDLQPARDALRAVLDEFDPAVRDAVFNTARLHALLHYELKHRGVIRQVHNLQSALQWLTSG